MLRTVEIGRSIREHAVNLLDGRKQMNIDEVSRTGLFRRVHSNTFPTSASLTDPLSLLESYGYIALVRPQKQGRGRPREPLIVINPLVLKSKNTPDPREKSDNNQESLQRNGYTR